MRTIVTHLSVDLDAITAIWLIKKYLTGWQNVDFSFVAAGSTLDNKPPDDNPEVIHVDTGFGEFDHHQTPLNTSAAKLVFEHLCEKKMIPAKDQSALERIVQYVNETDHFAEVFYPSAAEDRYDLCLHQLVFGLRANSGDDAGTIRMTLPLLEAALILFKNKISAESEIKKGYEFITNWGKSLVIETSNQESIKLALKNGYALVATKDPKKGSIRIKTLPQKKYDLSEIYKKIKEVDNKGTWFLHVSGNMLLNASSKNPNFIPSVLSSKKLIEILSKI